MADDRKFCTDCRWYRPLYGVELCAHEFARKVHTKWPRDTAEMRKAGGLCGYHGELWEPKPEPEPKRNWWRWW